MNTTLLGILVIIGMCATTLGLLIYGRRLGRRAAADSEDSQSANVAVEGAVFGLMGLLIAFTFSGAASRFETRRAQLVEEANCIGTAWLRVDLMPPDVQPALREQLRQYTDARMEAFNKIPDIDAAKDALNRANVLQNKIWKAAIAERRDDAASGQRLLLPALNEMFDMATTRTITAQLHPPPIIYGMLAILVMAGATLTGYDMGAGKSSRWFHALAFVVVISLAIYVILDFEFPRIGLIRIRGLDQVFVELRQSMNP